MNMRKIHCDENLVQVADLSVSMTSSHRLAPIFCVVHSVNGLQFVSLSGHPAFSGRIVIKLREG